MQGRYGVDQLANFLNGVLLTVIVISIFVHSRWLNLFILLLFIFSYSRIFSKNYRRCQAQNQWYLNKTAGIRKMFAKEKAYREIKKDYHIYTCKECGQKIKIPKGKGKIIVTCPKCGNEFQKKS